MAGDAVIGALRVVLGTDTAQFEDGLKKSTDSLGEFAKKAAEIATGIQLNKVFEETLKALRELTIGTFESADHMGKFSQAVGIPVVSLSGLTVAAKLADVSVEQLGTSMARLSVDMSKAAAGGVGPAASAFINLGISTSQLKSLGPDQILGLIADKFKAMPDGANKSAIAVALFGRAGQAMIPVLNKGSEGLAEMHQLADQLGLTLSKKTAESAEKFVDSTKLIGLSITGVASIVAAHFLPAMADSSEAFLHWIANGGAVQTTANGLIRTFNFLADNVTLFGTAAAIAFGPKAIAAVVSMAAAAGKLALSLVAAAVANVVLAGKWALIIGGAAAAGGALAYLTDTMGVFDKIFGTVIEKFKQTEIWSTFVAILDKLGISTKALTEPLTSTVGVLIKMKQTLTELAAEQQKLQDAQASEKLKAFTEEMAKLSLQTRETKGEFLSLGSNFVQAAISAKLFKDQTEANNFSLSKMSKGAQALSAQILKLDAALTVKELRTPYEKYADDIAKLIAQQEKGGLSAQKFADATARAFAKLTVVYGEVVANLVGGVASIFQALGAKNKTMFEIGKALAIAQATILTYVAAQKAFAEFGGTPLGYAAMAAAIATGIGNVIKITQTQYTPGAAMGGEFRVPGGRMGVDTKMISMALAPGELVKVTSAERASRGGGVQMIEMKPVRPGDLFSGDMVRGLFEALNRGYSDGYKVRFAT